MIRCKECDTPEIDGRCVYDCKETREEIESLRAENARLSDEREGVQRNYEKLHHEFAEIAKELPELARLRLENAKLRKENDRFREFILWLTPCGTWGVEHPEYAVIGRAARAALEEAK